MITDYGFNFLVQQEIKQNFFEGRNQNKYQEAKNVVSQ